MLPRRSLRIRQLNSRPASTDIASLPNNVTSESIGNAAKKRTHTKIMAEADTRTNHIAVQPKLKKMKTENGNTDPIAPFVLLPTEVLERIFIKVDDIGLLNLANTCTRFESIALTIASKRFADRHFVINSERLGGDRKIYAAIFNRFGIYINAIEMDHITDIDAKHWMAKMLRPHINHITKLTFDNCTFNQKNIFSRIMHKITHLEICNGYSTIETCNIDILKCRKLVRLVIRDFRGSLKETLKQIMRNNTGLQSIFDTTLHLGLFQENSILNHLNQLKEVGGLYLSKALVIRPDQMDRVVHTLRNLESLGLWLHPIVIQPLQRLGSECKRIKHLKLELEHDILWDDGMIEAVCSFQQIEYLNLSGACYKIDKIKSAVRCLPNLHHLRFDVWNYDFPFADILPLLRECPSLQTITVSLNDVHPKFTSTQFFNDFLGTIAAIGKSNARIEIEKLAKIVATMSRYGIVCQNKLIHWIGCDIIPESSDTHLLKLAEVLVKPKVEKEQSQEAVQRHLLDRIFEYLDVTSLYSFAETNLQCKQLVENHIKMHSKQNGLFTVTNEFYPFGHFCGMHKMFAPHVTNLKVHNLQSTKGIIQIFLRDYVHLTKVSIYDETISNWRFPRSLRHLILDGSEFFDSLELYQILTKPNLFYYKGIDTMELKNASAFNDLEYEKKHFRGIFKNSQLKSFEFNYRGEIQYKNLQKMFNGSKTKLVPIFPDYNHL